MTIADLNATDRGSFVAAVGDAFESSPWIAEAAWQYRPFASVDTLLACMCTIVADSPLDRRIALIAAHPDLAGRMHLSAASTAEQASAGLDRLSPEEAGRFEQLNGAYRDRFGFPFVICAREHDKSSILDALAERARNTRKAEIDIALVEIGKIARLRLRERISA